MFITLKITMKKRKQKYVRISFPILTRSHYTDLKIDF